MFILHSQLPAYVLGTLDRVRGVQWHYMPLAGYIKATLAIHHWPLLMATEVKVLVIE